MINILERLDILKYCTREILRTIQYYTIYYTIFPRADINHYSNVQTAQYYHYETIAVVHSTYHESMIGSDEYKREAALINLTPAKG